MTSSWFVAPARVHPVPPLQNVRIEILGPTLVAARSRSRIHLFRGDIYGRVAFLLNNGMGLAEIVASTTDTSSAAAVLLTIQELTNCAGSISMPDRLSRSPNGSGPEPFGDPGAPFRTCLSFETPLWADASGPGYYVYGKGRDPAQACTGCLAEAVERRGLEPPRDSADSRLNETQVPDNAVPLDELLPDMEGMPATEVLSWTPVQSLVSDAVRYVPTEFCFLKADSQHPSHRLLGRAARKQAVMFKGSGAVANGREHCRARVVRNPAIVRRRRISADSTGCASHSDHDEAVLNGFFEVVERDALRQWCLGKRFGHAVDCGGTNDSFVREVRRYLALLGRTLLIVDITAIPDIPAFAALSFDRAGRGVLGVSANFDAQTAADAAILEMGLALNWSHMVRCGRRALQPALTLESDMRIERSHGRRLDQYPCAALNARAGVAKAVAVMQSRGQDLLLLNQTSPGSSMSTVRVIVPGLYRFDPGALYRLAEASD